MVLASESHNQRIRQRASPFHFGGFFSCSFVLVRVQGAKHLNFGLNTAKPYGLNQMRYLKPDHFILRHAALWEFPTLKVF